MVSTQRQAVGVYCWPVGKRSQLSLSAVTPQILCECLRSPQELRAKISRLWVEAHAHEQRRLPDKGAVPEHQMRERTAVRSLEDKHAY